MFAFSHSLTCRYCGGSGLYFLKKRELRCKSGWTIQKICRDCVNEKRRISRKKSGELRTDKKREYQRQYRQKNRDKIREWWRESARRQRMKGKKFKDYRSSAIWDKYGSCLECKTRNEEHFAKGYCRKCYYKLWARRFRLKRKAANAN